MAKVFNVRTIDLLSLIDEVSLTLIDKVTIGLIKIYHRKTWKQTSCRVNCSMISKSLLRKKCDSEI